MGNLTPIPPAILRDNPALANWMRDVERRLNAAVALTADTGPTLPVNNNPDNLRDALNAVATALRGGS